MAQQNKKGESFGVRLGASLLYGTCKVLGWMPYHLLYYILSPFIYFVMYRLLRYRVAVTRANLAACFPEWDKGRLRSVEIGYYRHLAEVVVDTISLAGLSPKRALRRLEITNLQEHLAATDGKDWVAALGHFGSWEFFCTYALLVPNSLCLGVYHPLSSAVFDLFYRKLRSRWGLEPVAMKRLVRRMVEVRRSGQNFIIGLIADQTPPRRYDVKHWYDFMGRPTAFFAGLEHISGKFSTPVYYLHIERVRRGWYRGWFEEIYNGVDEVPEHEITQRYATKLQESIRRNPELWLWSHRRWKHQPTTSTTSDNHSGVDK